MKSNIKISQNQKSHIKALGTLSLIQAHVHQAHKIKNHLIISNQNQKSNSHNPIQINQNYKKQNFIIKCNSTTPEISTSTEENNNNNVTDIYPKNKMEIESIWEAIIVYANNGGVVIKNKEKLKGFVPSSKLDPSRIPKGLTEKEKNNLVGKRIRAKVVKVDSYKKCILSEKDLYIEEKLQKLNVGDIVKGKVDAIEDYGAFVHIKDKDGRYHGLKGLIHKSELSWEPVANPESIIKIGDIVEISVKKILKYEAKIELSLRKTKLDPLEESIDVLLPPGDIIDKKESYNENIQLEAINSLKNKLMEEEGINEVKIGRKAEERHKVSQDLELWLSKEVLEDGYAIVARSGKVLQELILKTNLTREEIKKLLTVVLRNLD